MENLGQIWLFFSISVVAALVVAMDVIIMPILLQYYRQQDATVLFV